MFKRLILAVVTVAFCQLSFAEQSDRARAPSAKSSLEEAKKILGIEPSFLKLMPEAALPGAWQEMRDVQLSSKTAIPNKYKELIGIAVAAQIPCRYCSYFHTQAATELGKATMNEVHEAIALAALTRHWSAYLSGIHESEAAFQKDLSRMFPIQKRQAGLKSNGTASGATSGEESTSTASESTFDMGPMAQSADDVYRDMRKTWGFVPSFVQKFSKEGIVGAWNETKALEFSPKTEIPMKYKALIDLAVAAQVPCTYCVQFSTKAAKAAGASDREINEAVAMASITRHWSTILNGNMVDEAQFRREADQIIEFVKAPKAMSGAPTSDTTSGTTTPADDDMNSNSEMDSDSEWVE